MGMFCYQCQETSKNTGCVSGGVCGKSAGTANLQDALVYVLKGVALYAEPAGSKGIMRKEAGRYIARALFSTITNANFDDGRISALIDEGVAMRESLKAALGQEADQVPSTGPAGWTPGDAQEMSGGVPEASVLSEKDEDARSLKEFAVYGLKGVAAYAHHAEVLGHEDDSIYAFMTEALAATTRELDMEQLKSLVMRTGKVSVDAMALLDGANTEAYGEPSVTEVSLEAGTSPGILISGHDLKDMQELLEQTQGTGVDVYTHSEMLPGNYYPAFKKYTNLKGNYGGSWWSQNSDFASFNGPILMTTNCIIPVKESYADRIYTTGMAGYPGVEHIPDREPGKSKDFSGIIEKAKGCTPPENIETGSITGGFAHGQLTALAGTIVDAVESGAIKRFIVMAGCDGRHNDREYFSDVAKKLPQDAVILTAGCAKYRYNKLGLGDIQGIPRVIDAGQCNDSYSLALIALKLKEVFGAEDVNDLPISFDVAWYEQKAVCVLLALLFLGFRNIRLGPTLPAFVSPNVGAFLTKEFGIKPIGDPDADVADMMCCAAGAGK